MSNVPRFCIRKIRDKKGRAATCITSAVGLSEQYLACGYLDKTVRFFNSESGEESMLCKGHKRTVTCMAMSSMGMFGEDPIVASGCRDGSVYFWDPDTFEIIDKMEFKINEIRSLSIYQGTEIYMIIGSRDSKVLIWDLKLNCLLMELTGHKGCIHAVLISSFCPDPDTLDPLDYLCVATGATDRTARLWDIKTGKRKKKLRHEHSVLSVALASKGVQPMMVTSGVEKVIRLWDYETGLQLMCLEGHLGMVNSLTVWEGFEMLVISASADRSIRVFDLMTGECVCTLIGHENDVRALVLSSVESKPTIVSISTDKCVGFWNLHEVIQTFYSNDEGALGVRNNTPAYNPPVDFKPPPEKVYTEEQLASRARRRAQRDEKRRLRMLAKQQRNGDAGGGGGDDADFMFDDDDDDFEDEGRSKKSKKKASKKKKGKKARDDEDDFDDDEDDDMFDGGDSDDDAPPPVPAVKQAAVSAAAPVVVAAAQSAAPRRLSIKDAVRKLSLMGASFLGGNKVQPVEDEVPATASESPTGKKGGALSSLFGGGQRPVESDETARNKANRVMDNFAQANISSAMEIERKKALQQQKLQERLNKKRGVTDAAEANSHDAIKEQKLKEHKLHEEQLKHNMALAQKRNNDALKRRLEEAKLKKQLNPTFSDSDSDDGNEKGKAKDKSNASGPVVSDQGDNLPVRSRDSEINSINADFAQLLHDQVGEALFDLSDDSIN